MYTRNLLFFLYVLCCACVCHSSDSCKDTNYNDMIVPDAMQHIKEHQLHNYDLLHLEAMYGHVACIEHKIDGETDVHVTTRDEGYTPLHIAAAYGQASVAQVLLKYGADVHARADQCILGRTPLHIAAACGHAHIVQLFVDYGANIEIMTQPHPFMHYYPKSPLFEAVLHGHVTAAQKLIQLGADITKGTWKPIFFEQSGYLETKYEIVTPLDCAIRKNDTHVMLLLLHHNADAYARSGFGYKDALLGLHGYQSNMKYATISPLFRSLLHGRGEAAQFLIQEGATLYPERSQHKETPHFCNVTGHVKQMFDACCGGDIYNAVQDDALFLYSYALRSLLSPNHPQALFPMSAIKMLWKLMSYGFSLTSSSYFRIAPVAEHLSTMLDGIDPHKAQPGAWCASGYYLCEHPAMKHLAYMQDWLPRLLQDTIIGMDCHTITLQRADGSVYWHYFYPPDADMITCFACTMVGQNCYHNARWLVASAHVTPEVAGKIALHIHTLSACSDFRQNDLNGVYRALWQEYGESLLGYHTLHALYQALSSWDIYLSNEMISHARYMSRHAEAYNDMQEMKSKHVNRCLYNNIATADTCHPYSRKRNGDHDTTACNRVYKGVRVYERAQKASLIAAMRQRFFAQRGRQDTLCTVPGGYSQNE